MIRNLLNYLTVAMMALVLSWLWTIGAAQAQDAAGDGIDELLQSAETVAAPAVTAPDPEQPVFYSYGREIVIGKYSIINQWMSGRRATEPAPAEPDQRFWRFFMHGVTDAGAMPKSWTSCLGPEQNPEDVLDFQADINNEMKSSNLPAIRLAGGQSILLKKPILSAAELSQLRGSYLRLFIWIKADNTGQGAELWQGAPSMEPILQDAAGNLIDVETTVFKTRGTYPWFCYHMDLAVPFNLDLKEAAAEPAAAAAAEPGAVAAAEPAAPAAAAVPADPMDVLGGFIDLVPRQLAKPEPTAEAGSALPPGAGLFLRLANPASGTAWFSTLSWKRTPYAESLFNTRTKATRVDPRYGTLAPNAEYDELPMHFFYGLCQRQHWDFLLGTKVLPNLTRVANLKAYLKTAPNDWADMVHVVPLLVYTHNCGVLLETAPPFEKDWNRVLATSLREMQDLRTGMWKVNGQPNLLATWKIANNSFNPTRQQRADRPKQPTPWLSVDEMPLSNAEAMVNTLLKTQRPAPRSSLKAGWNLYLFTREDLDTPAQHVPCDIVATAAAVNLLAQAMPLVSDQLQAQASEAIYQAWHYVMKFLVFRDLGIWRMRHGDQEATSPAFFYAFLEATPWLEMRQVPGVQPPVVEAFQGAGGRMSFKWINPREDQVSLRVYAAPEDMDVKQLSEQHLVAIIQPGGESIDTMDPLLALRFMVAASMKKWLVGPEHDGADYLAEKVAALPEKMKNCVQSKEISVVPEPHPEKVLKFYAAAVNAYGEMSAWQTLPVTLAP
ncbi:MAG: hypothetical protein ACOX6W_14920 [Lentisphaeria bacterium]